MGEKEINVTYETIFDMLRREKNRDELQHLSETFFTDVAAYLEKKRGIIEQSSSDLFEDAKHDSILQLRNSTRLLKELYERREKKIIAIAINKSRTKSNLIDTSALQEQEKQLYIELTQLLDKYRGTILGMFSGEKKEAIKQPELSDTVQVIISKETPKFYGEDMESYGPFSAGQRVVLPQKLADVLINNGSATLEEKAKPL